MYFGQSLYEALNWADGGLLQPGMRKSEVYFECLVYVGTVKRIMHKVDVCGHEYDHWQDEQPPWDSISAEDGSGKQWAVRDQNQIMKYALWENWKATPVGGRDDRNKKKGGYLNSGYSIE